MHESSTPPAIDTRVLGPVETNCFLISAPGGDDPHGCFVVDCGMQPDPLIQLIRERGLEPRGLLLTHCHYDHIGGIDQLFEAFGVLPTHVHELEAEWNRDPMLNLSGMSGFPCIAPAPDLRYAEGDVLDLLGTPWEVLHLPGHSPGSVGLLDRAGGTLIAGDTLFAGSIGRVDFPTSDPHQMKRTLARLLELPDGIEVHPGHGPATTIGRERQSNPFLLDMDRVF
ncbi:MAG: MBL fold metallo-hydrolase [Planctomycetota bacterium]|nr:MBL fold metallo-hydrolase [Planctomycetota bacterium]